MSYFEHMDQARFSLSKAIESLTDAQRESAPRLLLTAEAMKVLIGETTRLDKLHACADLLTILSQDLTVDSIADFAKKSKLPELARLHVGYRSAIDTLGDSKTALQKAFDWLRISHMPVRMDDEDLDSFTVEGVGRVYLTASLNASIKAGAKEGAYEYLTDNGHGDLISTTVNASSLKALAKKKIQDNDPLPADLFNVSPMTTANIQKK